MSVFLLFISTFAGFACTGEDPEGGSPVPAPQPTAESTLAPLEPEEIDWLVDVMAVLPASVADSGVWFANPALAVALEDIQPARTREEWESWTPEQQQAYWDARAGIPGISISHSMRYSSPDWDDTFGFGAWDTAAMAETGANPQRDAEVNILLGRFNVQMLLGRFDPARVTQKLLDFGYERRSHLGAEYLTLPEDVRPKPDWVSQVMLDRKMRNLLVQERSLITAPTEERMQELLSARAGETPSLMDHAAFGDLASIAPDPHFAAILDRQSVRGQEEMGLASPLERPDEWGKMGRWEALSAVFSRPSPGLKRIAFSLWYADLTEAQKDAAELALRFNPSEPSDFHTMLYLTEVCADSWQIETISTPKGAVLEVACQAEEGQAFEDLGPMMNSALSGGTIGVLTE